MKKFIAFLLASSALLLAGCGGKSAPRAKPGDVGIVNPVTEIEYVECDGMRLYPQSPYDSTADQDTLPDVYMTYSNNGNTTEYYPVMFEDPTQFLCYEYDGYYYLMRNKDVKEPTIAEFEPIAAAIYNSTDTIKLGSFLADEEYTSDNYEGDGKRDTDLCRLVAEHITNGEKVDFTGVEGNTEDVFYLHMYSQKYPGLYYNIIFFGLNGRYFLRDASIDKTVYCPREIILRMVGDK